MTALLPAPIVPSNAPPQSDVIHGQHTSRVLREHSGNRQHDYYGSSLEQKYPSAYLSENTYSTYQHVPRPAHVSQQTLLQHNRSRHGQHRHIHGQRDPQQIRKEARYLFQRFKAADGYNKYRNRQSKDDKGTGEGAQKWPDRLEYAFFEGVWLPSRCMNSDH